MECGHGLVGDERDGAGPGHERSQVAGRSRCHVNPRGGEDDTVRIRLRRVRHVVVERPAALEELAERVAVARERTIAPRPPPRRVHVDLEDDGERVPSQLRPHRRRLDRPASQRDDRGRAVRERAGRHPLLDRAEAAVLDQLRDRAAGLLHHDRVGVDERAVQPAGDLGAECGLAGAHEPREGEVPA